MQHTEGNKLHALQRASIHLHVLCITVPKQKVTNWLTPKHVATVFKPCTQHLLFNVNSLKSVSMDSLQGKTNNMKSIVHIACFSIYFSIYSRIKIVAFQSLTAGDFPLSSYASNIGRVRVREVSGAVSSWAMLCNCIGITPQNVEARDLTVSHSQKIHNKFHTQSKCSRGVNSWRSTYVTELCRSDRWLLLEWTQYASVTVPTWLVSVQLCFNANFPKYRISKEFLAERAD